jgi:PAS domain S-box-containing protein
VELKITLSRGGKAYVWTVIAVGSALIAASLLQLQLGASTPYWLVLAAFTLFSGTVSLRSSSTPLTISASEAFVFALALWFGPAPAVVTVAVDGLIVSMRGKNRNTTRALFCIAEPAISVWVSAQLFFALTGAAPLFWEPASVVPLLMPLLALTTSYFLLNGWLTAVAVWCETGVSPNQVLRDQARHLSINYLASLCLVTLLVVNATNFGLAAIGLLVPLFVLSHVSSKIAVEHTDTRAALRDSEARFIELAESVNQVPWRVQTDTGHAIYVSPAYERTWGGGVDGNATSDADWRDGIHPDDRDRVVEAFRTTASSGGVDVDYRVVRPDGGIRWIKDRVFPVTDPDGMVRRVVGIAEDTTERRSLEQQLIQSQKLEGIGRMAGGIAHDFNNILTVIVGRTGKLLGRAAPSDPHAADLREIQAAGEKAAALTRHLLAFSRQQVLEMTVLDLNGVVRDVNAMLTRLIGEDIVIDIQLASDVGHIEADASQLERMLVNLAVNARDAMPRGGNLTIETFNRTVDKKQVDEFAITAGCYSVLAVSDTGSGMDEHTRAHIFDPFFTTKETGQGSGLGLATLYGTVKQLGGHISLHSAPRRGARFEIYLPQTTEPLGQSRRSDELRHPQPARKTVLLVEDDESVRAVVMDMLEEGGYHVLEAEGPEMALALADRHDEAIDLMLTDLIMPGMRGWELAARFKSSRPQTAVLYMSGYSEEAVLGQHGANVTREALIAKPFTDEALLERVCQALSATGSGPRRPRTLSPPRATGGTADTSVQVH